MKSRNRSFPCWVCQGKGYIHEDTIDWWKIEYRCDFCDGKGMIPIDSIKHQEIVEAKIRTALQKLRPIDADDFKYLVFIDSLDLEIRKHVAELVRIYTDLNSYQEVDVDDYWENLSHRMAL